MRGGYNPDLDGDDEEDRARPADHSPNAFQDPRSGEQPIPDDGVEGDRPFVSSSNYGRRPKPFRPNRPGYYFDDAVPSFMPTGGGFFHLTKQQKLREEESKPEKTVLISLHSSVIPNI